MVKIEIDGKPITVAQGSMIIEVADEAGIPIPRFCYHKKLSIAANCRMCLVDVENAPKPLPACATPVSEGMKIHTHSKKAKDAQKAVMEFLLINHPLDCPICDQGGQCELQDVALEYGRSYSEFHEGKRVVKDKDIGPLISTEMTRCIQCTRCVRFGDEIAGQKELGATGRGEFTEIGTFVEQSVNSELSGNVVDLCPVGALTSKPFRFKARAWETYAKSGVSGHDCIGSNIYYHTMRGRVVRAVPRDNEAVNEVWLSDRDRYSYEGLYNNRLTDPMVKKNGVWEKVEWADALAQVSEHINKLIEKYGPSEMGALLSPNTTVEEAYLAQKILRNKGVNSIDHRLRQANFDLQVHQTVPSIGVSFSALEEANTLLLIGCDVRYEAPLLGVRIRKATKQGAQIFAIHPVLPDFNFPLTECLVEKQGDMLLSLLHVLKAVLASLGDKAVELPENIQKILSKIECTEVAQRIAQQLQAGENVHALLGAYVQTSPDSALITYISRLICKLTGATFGELTYGANSAGCWIAGALPHQGACFEPHEQGHHALAMLKTPKKGYFLVGAEPDFDFIDPELANSALKAAELVVAFSAYDNPSIKACADIILPITPLTETKGSLVNAQGDWQHFEAVTPPLGHSKPLWKVLRVLGNFWHLPDMEYETLTEVLNEIKAKYQGVTHPIETILSANLSFERTVAVRAAESLVRLAPVPLYSVDPLVRQSDALQKTYHAQTMKKVSLNTNVANQYQIATGDVVVVTQGAHQSDPILVEVNDRVPDDTVIVPSGIYATRGLGSGFSTINIQKSEQG